MLKTFKPAPVELLTHLQDVAWFTIQFRSLSRGSELSDLRTDRMMVGPNDSCLAFQVTFSKVLRGSGTEEFGVPAIPGDATCPVRAFKAYRMAPEQYFQWEWGRGSFPVFPFIHPQGNRLTAVTAAAMHQRFHKHLQRAQDALGQTDMEVVESLHGLRAGGALDMALAGKSLADIMAQGFWKSPTTARHYIGVLERIVGADFAKAVRERGLVAARHLQGLGSSNKSSILG